MEGDPSNRTEELLRRANGGDVEARERLILEHVEWIARRVRGRIGARLRRKDQTEDLVQSTLREVLQYGPRFEVATVAQFRALLAMIVENVLRGRHEWFTRKRRDMHREATAAGQTRQPVELAARSATSPSGDALRAEGQDVVRLALELLDPLDREVVVRREYDGESWEQIAASVGLGADGARKRFARAVRKLSTLVLRLRSGDFEGALD